MVLSILVHISRNYIIGLRDASSEKNTKKAMVKKAIKYIRKNYSNPLSLDEIAAGIGFSRYYFCHIFKEMTGMSVISYINLIRCENAKSLMLLRKYSISEIALMCGFENFSYFSKTYKKYMGRLPSEDMK